MNSRACHSPAGGRARAVLAGATLLGAWVSPAVADTPQAAAPVYGTTFVPHLGAAAAWTDNIDLVPSGQAEDGEIGELMPGIYLKHDSQYLHGTLDYEAQEYFYGGGQHGHDTYQQGNLFAEGTALQNWLYLDVAGSQMQSVVDPTRNANINLLYPTGNLANETTAQGTPMLRHKFQYVEVDAGYSWGFQRYQAIGSVDEQLPDTANRDGNFKLSSVDPDARLTWDTLYQRQETTYTNIAFPRWLYEVAQADLGVLVTPSIRLLGEGGKESDLDTSISAGGFGSPFWLAGFEWSPDRLTEAKLMAGKRFFGNTYQALIRHQSRLLNVQVDYNELPTTNSNRFLPQEPLPSQIVIPGAPLFQRVTADIYVLKELDARVALTGRLTEVGLQLSSIEQNYLTFNGLPVGVPTADQFRSATLYVNRRMGTQLTGNIGLTYDHTDLREGTLETYDDRFVTARLTDQVGLRTAVTLAFTHYVRTGALDFNVNMVTLMANMTFGNGPAVVPGAFPNGIAPGPMAPGPMAPGPIAAPVPGIGP